MSSINVPRRIHRKTEHPVVSYERFILFSISTTYATSALLTKDLCIEIYGHLRASVVLTRPENVTIICTSVVALT